VPTDPDDALASLTDFIAGSPSPFHAVANAASRLDAAGFSRVVEADAWPQGGDAYVVRGGALVAWRQPNGTPAATPFRLVGAHTDSPNLRLKPRPDTGAVGWRQLAVEVYGSPLLNSWLDRDLGLSGRLVLRDGSSRLVRVGRPVARVAQLAIHLDREVTEKGLVLDKQQHLTPVWGLGAPREGDLIELVAAEAGVPARDVVSSSLMLDDLTPPARLGLSGELLAAPRLDNQVSCWAGLTALVGASGAAGVPVVALFDHEEVGSGSTAGAAGPLVEAVLERLVLARGGTREDFLRALATSACVSADMAHAVHPNYPDRHEPGHRPLPNKGPVLKVNVNQRYATSDESAAAFIGACEAAGVPWQVFVSRNNLPCGSTIGPISATRLGIPTVDVGCAQLSMHSARELCGANDPAALAAALTAFLAD
jgi:aspartyl aminopeptidase